MYLTGLLAFSVDSLTLQIFRVLLLFGFFETGSHNVGQAVLKLEILLPQPSKCWGFRCASPYLASILYLRYLAAVLA
jgi:hypothetical protein